MRKKQTSNKTQQQYYKYTIYKKTNKNFRRYQLQAENTGGVSKYSFTE